MAGSMAKPWRLGDRQFRVFDAATVSAEWINGSHSVALSCIRWNYVQLVARDVIAHHVATVVADPQIIAAGLPIETNGVANAVSDDVGSPLLGSRRSMVANRGSSDRQMLQGARR